MKSWLLMVIFIVLGFKQWHSHMTLWPPFKIKADKRRCYVCFSCLLFQRQIERELAYHNYHFVSTSTTTFISGNPIHSSPDIIIIIHNNRSNYSHTYQRKDNYICSKESWLEFSQVLLHSIVLLIQNRWERIQKPQHRFTHN